MPESFSYNKQEKLKSRKLIEHVFAARQSLSVFPLKILYIVPETEMDFFIKTGVGTSSKTFKKAVDRNRIKRLLREVYRLNKTPLHNFLNEHKKQLAVFILYTGKEMPQMAELQIKMPLAINKLIKALHEKPAANN